MIGSLYSGISGLKANTSAMAVIGDNIANVDTNGFKSSRVSFANVFSSTLSQPHLQIGRGVTLNGVTPSGTPVYWKTPAAPPTCRSMAPACL
jgi:flagellar hook protein FlgE